MYTSKYNIVYLGKNDILSTKYKTINLNSNFSLFYITEFSFKTRVHYFRIIGPNNFFNFFSKTTFSSKCIIFGTYLYFTMCTKFLSMLTIFYIKLWFDIFFNLPYLSDSHIAMVAQIYKCKRVRINTLLFHHKKPSPERNDHCVYYSTYFDNSQ